MWGLAHQFLVWLVLGKRAARKWISIVALLHIWGATDRRIQPSAERICWEKSQRYGGGVKARKDAPGKVGGVRHDELAVVVAARVMAEPRNPEQLR